MSESTKKYKRDWLICRITSIAITVIPLLIYVILGFCNGTTGQKFTLGILLITAIIFVAINILFKHSIRSTIWILLVGIHACVENIMSLLIIMMITTLIDEFILDKLAKKYKEKYTINNEIDKRGA